MLDLALVGGSVFFTPFFPGFRFRQDRQHVIGHVRTPYLFDSTSRQVGFDLCVEITFENGHPGYWPMVQLQPRGELERHRSQEALICACSAMAAFDPKRTSAPISLDRYPPFKWVK